ncbi:MAG: hypothetical protein KF787_08195 [Phycisphaeraceae bacterium]|nr:hypothetical protein [Phycisphaerae bacterium]MBX3392614.1 hypothetical protein [Phycisphaeraceae bacterium]HRJ49800.1 hypothetical protein [Phycisphaerales bacterium]
MIEPSPTTRIAPHLTRGVLHEVVAQSATRPGHIVLRIPNTSYLLSLIPVGPLEIPTGKGLIGVVRARARRVDTTGTGGRFIEPVQGRPRRVQGFVIGTDPGARTITVEAGVPMVCELTDERQFPSDFTPGQFVGFDVMDGATFET